MVQWWRWWPVAALLLLLAGTAMKGGGTCRTAPLASGTLPSKRCVRYAKAHFPALPNWSQVRCLVDYPGEKLPSVTGGELEWYLLDTVAPQVGGCLLQGARKVRTHVRRRSCSKQAGMEAAQRARPAPRCLPALLSLARCRWQPRPALPPPRRCPLCCAPASRRR